MCLQEFLLKNHVLLLLSKVHTKSKHDRYGTEQRVFRTPKKIAFFSYVTYLVVLLLLLNKRGEVGELSEIEGGGLYENKHLVYRWHFMELFDDA